MEDKAKIERCKYSHPHFKNNSIEYHCVVDGWEDDKDLYWRSADPNSYFI